MKWIVEDSLTNFKFWSGAAENAKMLEYSELQELDDQLEEYFGGNTPTDTEINDLFWFDFDTVCSLIGLKYDSSRDVIIRDGDEEEEEEDESADLESADKDMKAVCESIRKDNPVLADAIEAGFKACMEGAIGDVHDRWSDHSYSPDVVMSDKPNYTVIVAIDSMDPHPARISVQAANEADAIDDAVTALVDHGMPGYVETDEPEHPEDYIEVSKGWVKSDLVNVNKTDGNSIRATYVPERFLSALINDDRTGLTDDDEAELEEFCKDLAEAGIPESGLYPVCGPDGEFWDVDEDFRVGNSVLCSVFVGK